VLCDRKLRGVIACLVAGLCMSQMALALAYNAYAVEPVFLSRDNERVKYELSRVNNGMLAWSFGTFGLSVDIDDDAERSLIRLDRRHVPLLREMLARPHQFAVAHVLLTRLHPRAAFSRGLERSWNGMTVELHPDCTVSYRGGAEEVEELWSAFYGNPVK